MGLCLCLCLWVYVYVYVYVYVLWGWVRKRKRESLHPRKRRRHRLFGFRRLFAASSSRTQRGVALAAKLRATAAASNYDGYCGKLLDEPFIRAVNRVSGRVESGARPFSKMIESVGATTRHGATSY